VGLRSRGGAPLWPGGMEAKEKQEGGRGVHTDADQSSKADLPTGGKRRKQDGGKEE